jgi:predicted enzyme related to lactoylglutathione lyase
MGSKVVHFEMNGPDGKALESFYSQLFGWTTTEVPEANYALVDTHGGTGINGGIGTSPTGSPHGTFYVGVDDMNATLEKAESLGGKTIMPVTDMGMVTFALFADPDGLTVGLVDNTPPPEGTPTGPSAGDGAPVDWFEVLGSDADKTLAFYRDLFGWTADAAGFPGYSMVSAETAGIGGGIGAGEGSKWVTSYAQVPDVEASLAKAESLGGERVYGPNDAGPVISGAFKDPAGNIFGVYFSKES